MSNCLAKIAVKSGAIPAPDRRRTIPQGLDRSLLAIGKGWSVSHITCELGPRDGVQEEQHSGCCIAIVRGGSFQYRSSAGRELMTPGSLLLGNPGQSVEYRHEHGIGDRCISFSYTPERLAEIAADALVNGLRFPGLRIPPLREFSGLLARACALDHRQTAMRQEPARVQAESTGTPNSVAAQWEEIGFELASRVLQLPHGNSSTLKTFPGVEARITRIVRIIHSRVDAEHPLDELAREAKLSRYHFLRLFRQLTGLTPHQYVLRLRLQRAAMRLLVEPSRVLDIAFDCGFGDVSNFNHAFRTEFGVSPRAYRNTVVRS